MEDVKRILVVARMTKYSRKAFHYGVALAQKNGAKLFVIHVVHDPFIFGDWNLPIPNLEEEYRKAVEEAKSDLRALVAFEKKKGMEIEEMVREGDPTKEILKAVKENDIDLIVMPAHEEGRLEHFLFGRSNEELLRRMPCSIMMVKSAV